MTYPLRYPDAHRDPVFRAWAAKQWEEHARMVLIRYNAKDAFTLMRDDSGVWHEIGGESTGRTHDIIEIARALS